MLADDKHSLATIGKLVLGGFLLMLALILAANLLV